MKLLHLPPVLFLFVTALSLPSLSFHRHLCLRRSPPSSSQSQHAGDDDALLLRLAAVDAGAEYVLAEATALLSNASITSTPSPSNNAHHHRLLTLRLPVVHSSNGTASGEHQTTAYRLRVPRDELHLHANDGALLAAFRASLRSFLLAHRPHTGRDADDTAAADIAGVMRDLPGLLALRRRFPTCAVIGNSGILLGFGRGPQIDAHDFIIRLNNGPAGGDFARDVGSRISLSPAHSTVLRRCATSPGGRAACHPYGRAVPLAMYVSHGAHLLDALVCNTTAATPFPVILTDPRARHAVRARRQLLLNVAVRGLEHLSAM